MKRQWIRWGSIALMALWPAALPSAQSPASAAAAATQDVQLAGPPKPGYMQRSKSPELEVPAEHRTRPAIRRPANPQPRDPEKDGPLAPPGSIVVYRPATGEIRFETPPPGWNATAKVISDAMPSSTGLLGSWPSKQTVIGPDERVRIEQDQVTGFPWRVIAKLYVDFPKPSYWVATGALIGHFHVLTAGHAVYQVAEGGWITQMEFVPGKAGNYEPFSSAWDVEVRIPAEYFNNEDPDFDWALVTLDRNVGRILGWLGYAYEPLSWYPGKVLSLAGYPGDKDDGLYMYWSYNQVTQVTERALFHVIDSYAGQSGGPIWRYIQQTDQSQIMAVHTYGDDQGVENSATRINADIYGALQSWSLEDVPPIDYADLIDDGYQYAGFSPNFVTAGTPFEVHCDVRNIGTTDTAGFLVSFYASEDKVITALDHYIGSCFVPNLEPFSYVTCPWQGPFPATIRDGVYYVGWIIDSNNNVDEISENNNTEYLDNQLTVGGGSPANIRISLADFNTGGLPQVSPGTNILLSAFLENTGPGITGPFWLEFWGSRTGGFMTDLFMANSVGIPSIAAGGTHSFASWIPLSSVPDGPYTIVMIADRPNQVAETDETDNVDVVGGKRIVVLRPQTNADMAIQGFSFGPDPVFTGQPIQLGGTVRNAGTQNTGPFWVEFWGSFDRLYPTMDFFLCDSIGVPDLAPGQSIQLSSYQRNLYTVPSGIFMVGVVIDRIDQVSERDETNNYWFIDGRRLNQSHVPTDELETKDPGKMQLPDLVVTSADFSPFSPTQLQPGMPVSLSARIENQSAVPSGSVWIEFWGSRTGGLTLDEFIADSAISGTIGPWGALDLNLSRSLYSIPDGPYSIVVVVDRPGYQAELNEGNNRRPVAGKRLLTIRPQTQANMRIENFTAGPSTLRPGQRITLTGRVVNDGTQSSGPFWIEFFGTFTPDAPFLDFFLCDSIPVGSIPPGGSIDLSTYTRTLYSWIPAGATAVICFVDRTDLVNETHEEDNYDWLAGYTISP